jgi:NAD(P)-dependent dehydrogenase (short-subunit alcohol dehydrogenase family)
MRALSRRGRPLVKPPGAAYQQTNRGEDIMDLGLNGKVALVTGASRGIGRAIAIELAREGCDVALAARSAEGLGETADIGRDAPGRRALAHAVDLREADAAAGFVAAALSEYGRIDLVVNNAGATKRGEFATLTDADFHDGFALKFHGYVRLARAAWPHLKATKGTMINIIGAGGRTASADFTIGGSVNAALYNFTKAMAQLGLRDGVRVTGINPGPIETDRLKARLAVIAKEENVDDAEARRREMSKNGVMRFGLPEEIGQLVCFLASPVARNIHGALVDSDSGATRAI